MQGHLQQNDLGQWQPELWDLDLDNTNWMKSDNRSWQGVWIGEIEDVNG